LDPAGLLFRGDKKTPAEKLDVDDAEFVEVIHTNMGQLGLEGRIGHADFYPVCIIDDKFDICYDINIALETN